MRSVRHLVLFLAAALALPGTIATDAAAANGKSIATAKPATKRRGEPRRGARPTSKPFVKVAAKPAGPKVPRKAEGKRATANQLDEVAKGLEGEAARLSSIADDLHIEAFRLGNELEDARSTLTEARRKVAELRDQIGRLNGALGKGKGRGKGRIQKRDHQKRELAETRRALSAAEADVQVAETAVADVTAAVEAVVRKETGGRAIADKATKIATGARSKAENARFEAEEAEARAADIAKRWLQRMGNRDQHEAWMAQQDAGRLKLYRDAVRRTRSWTIIEPKPGEVTQDAVAAAPELGLFAISDGVTNSSYSGEFARVLVRRWTEQPPANLGGFPAWLAGVQVEWAEEVEPKQSATKGTWYNRRKAILDPEASKAYAAFVGAKLFSNGGRQQLRLVGIGDTVAILLRGGKIKQSFPLVENAEFSDFVKALPSKGTPPFKVREAQWDVKPGDEVFMATDALAAWVFAEVEAGRDPFPQLRQLKTAAQMREFVERARAGALPGQSTMGVDDTTLARFVVPLP